MTTAAQSKPIVSFCLPLYNNSEGAFKIITSLLSSSDTRYEVIASDDASTDDTQKLLAQIHDDRFKYFRNEKNLGAHKNWLRSLELGRGEWLFLIMGRDMMNGGNITKLITLLEQADKDGVNYLRDHGHYRDGLKLSEGISAMSNFIGYNHQTGEIFRRDEFMRISEREHYFSISDMYPENYAIRDLLLRGRGAFIHSGVCGEGFATDKSKVVSKVEYGLDINNTFFAFPRRVKQTFEQIDMIDEMHDIFSRSERDYYFSRKYYSMLTMVSYWYKVFCRDSVNMAHYGQPVRHISIPGMIRNMLKARRETKAHLKDKGTYTLKRQLIMLCSTAKAVVHISVKSAIRDIIEPLGIWRILHYIRNY